MRTSNVQTTHDNPWEEATRSTSAFQESSGTQVELLPRTARAHLQIRMKTSGQACPEGGNHWCCWEKGIQNRHPWNVIPNSLQIHLSRFSEAPLFAVVLDGRSVRTGCCCFLGCSRGSDYARTASCESCLRLARMMMRPKLPSAMQAGNFASPMKSSSSRDHHSSAQDFWKRGKVNIS